MTVKELKMLFGKIESEMGNYEIWLSSDEEGNDYLPMYKDLGLSMAIDEDKKRIILFPSHYFPGIDDYF